MAASSLPTKRNTEYWRKLRGGNILGIIDSHGCVHSKFTEHVEFHTAHFPISPIHWRWSFDRSTSWFASPYKPDIEQQDAIERHITKMYGIPFWDNGHHDIDFFLKKLKRGKNENI